MGQRNCHNHTLYPALEKRHGPPYESLRNVALPFWPKKKTVTCHFWLVKQFNDPPLDFSGPPSSKNECSLRVMKKLFEQINNYSLIEIPNQHSYNFHMLG